MKRKIIGFTLAVLLFAPSVYAASWKTTDTEDSSVNGGEIVMVENEGGTDNNWMSLTTIKAWVLNALSAASVAIVDAGDYLAATNVETGIQELAAELAGKLDAGDVVTVQPDVETMLGSDNNAEILSNIGIPGLSVMTGPVALIGNAGGSSQITIANGTANIPAGNIVERDENVTLTYKTLGTGSVVGTGTTVPVVLMIAASDEDTAITAAAGKRTFRAPYSFTLTGVRASCKTAPTGANLVIDVNETGTTSVLATKVTIEAGEYSSVDATTQPVVGDPTIADNADMSIDFDTVGSTVAGSGVKVYLYGTRVLP